jgi:hypothetical protein
MQKAGHLLRFQGGTGAQRRQKVPEKVNLVSKRVFRLSSK